MFSNYFSNIIFPFLGAPIIKQEPYDYLKEYCDATSLHGWFFYGGSSSEKKTSFSGFFWISVLAASMSAAVFVMGNNIQGTVC